MAATRRDGAAAVTDADTVLSELTRVAQSAPRGWPTAFAAVPTGDGNVLVWRDGTCIVVRAQAHVLDDLAEAGQIAWVERSHLFDWFDLTGQDEPPMACHAAQDGALPG